MRWLQCHCSTGQASAGKKNIWKDLCKCSTEHEKDNMEVPS